MNEVITGSEILNKVMAISDENRWEAEIMWFAPIPEHEVVIGGWTFRKQNHDKNTYIPPKAAFRIDHLRDQKIPIWEVLVGHEPEITNIGKKEVTESEIIEAIGVTVITGLIILAIIGVLTAIVLSIGLLLLPVFMVAGMAVAGIAGLALFAGIDPCLVAIVEIETGQLAWVKVAEWNE